MYRLDMTWKQNILFVLSDGKWKSRRQIKNALGLTHRQEPTLTRALSSYILLLVRSGHIERALAPDQIKTNPHDHVKYVYRRTRKFFEMSPASVRCAKREQKLKIKNLLT